MREYYPPKILTHMDDDDDHENGELSHDREDGNTVQSQS